MIVILGPEDIHTTRVLKQIKAQGKQGLLLDSIRFPVDVGLSYDAASPCQGTLRIPGRPAIPLSGISAVYWYSHQGIQVPYSQDPQDLSYRRLEAETAFNGFLSNMDCLWVNPIAAIMGHKNKAHQLKQMKQAGIRVPDSLITNDADALRAFYEKHDRQIICKPNYQGTLFHRLTEADFTPERLSALAANPVLFQEYIDGTDIRIHIVGEEAFASEIHCEHFYYKTSPFELAAIDPPPELLADCLRVVDTLGLLLAGLDVRRTTAGEHVFFEANPSPQYLIFEDRNAYPITETLVKLLSQTHG